METRLIFFNPEKSCRPPMSTFGMKALLEPLTPSIRATVTKLLQTWGGVLMRIGLFGAALGLCLVGLCSAQTSHASMRKDLKLPAEPLGSALQDLAKLYDFQLLYHTDLAKDLKTQGASGSLTSDEALTKVLSGTGLAYKYLDANTVTVFAASQAVTSAPQPVSATPVDDDTKNKEAGKKSSQDFRVAQVDQTNAGPQVDQSKDKSSDQGPSRDPNAGLAEILIKGSRIMNVDVKRTEDDVQPYTILTSEQIEQSGATDVEDFLKQRLTMNTTFQSNSQQYGNNAVLGNTSSINLRGLGTNETLILIDGRRSAGISNFGFINQTDINGIPLSAIERIEVLPSSASAIYGGAAVGGVVNIILKKNFQGGDVRGTFENTTSANAPLRTMSGTYGFSLLDGKTQVMLSGHYADGTPLILNDRINLFERGIATILQNAPSNFYNLSFPFPGATTNIAGIDANFNPINLLLKNGTPLNSSITYIPAGTAPGSNVAAGVLQNAGKYNLALASGSGPYGLQNPIGTVPTDKSLMMTVRQEISSALEGFTEFSTSSNSSRKLYNPFVDPLLVPASAPDNPFQETVSINLPSAIATPQSTDSVTQSVTVGLLAHLSASWNSELDYTWSRNSFEFAFDNYDISALESALGNGTVNPFADTLAYPPNLAPYLSPNSYSGRSTLNDLGLRMSGPMWSLPWGSPTLTVGVEHRKEGIGNADYYQLAPSYYFHQLFFGQSQSTNSVYAEAQVPLITEKNAVPLVRSLDLQLAGRSESYTVSAGTPYVFLDPADAASSPPQGVHKTIKYTSTNPTMGLKYKPIEDVIVRASYSRAFLPPTSTQLLPDPRQYPNNPIIDPQNGRSYNVNAIYGGNPDLQPQTSKDWDLGVIFEPQEGALHGLRTDLEYYKITQPNYITYPAAQQIVSDPAFANRVSRDPVTGLITVVNLSPVNATEYRTNGWDLTLDYRAPTKLGTFTLHALGTLIENDQRQYTIGSPFLEYVGYPAEGGEGKVKANGTLTWEYRHWTLGWTTTYFGKYYQTGSPGSPSAIENGGPNTFYTAEQGGYTIPSQIYHGVFASYASGSNPIGQHAGAVSHLLSNLEIQLSVKNIFNTLPPFDAFYSPYYYSQYGDLRLRTYRISIVKGF